MVGIGSAAAVVAMMAADTPKPARSAVRRATNESCDEISLASHETLSNNRSNDYHRMQRHAFSDVRAVRCRVSFSRANAFRILKATSV